MRSQLGGMQSWPGWIITLTIVLDIIALASIWRGSRRHSPPVKVIWTSVTILLPLLGALGWLLLGRERRRKSRG
ncbi:MAG: PLDc N-terminal domain-containing protein [Gemmatimonadaceae bacterium]